jgi:hypothetical protein
VYRYPGSPADTGEVKYQYEAPREDVRRPLVRMASRSPGNYYGREIIIKPTLEKREVVISRTRPQPPRYEHPLDDVRLPPGFAKNGKWHWPRQ